MTCALTRLRSYSSAHCYLRDSCQFLTSLTRKKRQTSPTTNEEMEAQRPDACPRHQMHTAGMGPHTANRPHTCTSVSWFWLRFPYRRPHNAVCTEIGNPPAHSGNKGKTGLHVETRVHMSGLQVIPTSVLPLDTYPGNKTLRLQDRDPQVVSPAAGRHCSV